MYRVFNNVFITVIISLVGVMILPNCGRKQRGVFSFPPKDQIKVHKLAFPSVRGLRVCQKQGHFVISWQPIDIEAIHETKYGMPQLSGYNVYRLVKGYFVPKEPLNKKPLIQTTYIDTPKKRNGIKHSYLVRAVFVVGDQVIEGPASQIVSAQ